MKKNMRKLVSAILLTMCMLVCCCAPALAVDELGTSNTEDITPYYVGVSNVFTNPSISGGQAYCTSTVSLRSGYTATLTMSLQRSSNGSSWSSIKTWSGSGSSLSGSYYVSSGYKYRTKCTAKIYKSGSYVETATAYSNTKSY